MKLIGLTFIAVGLCMITLSDRSLAQIIPDNSLGSESSQVLPETIQGQDVTKITGGARRGAHLFHSFTQFNINEGSAAYFTNPDNITNIFSRVTGNHPSKIFGTLGVLGKANLFLINPQGIVFGPQAQLDLRGSFIATSADSVLFDNGWAFSASQPQVPLLNINIPIGLNFRNPGTITNQSQATKMVLEQETPVGLAVDPGQTLALVGGDLNMTGNLTSFNGNILLGSVANEGLVKFQMSQSAGVDNFGLDYDHVSTFGNINLSGNANVNTTGLGGGPIDIRSGNLTLKDHSQLTSYSIGNLDGRDLTINTNQLSIENLGLISTGTTSTGKAGNITVNAQSIDIFGGGYTALIRVILEDPLSGSITLNDARSGILSGTIDAGKGGNITINTENLNLKNGALIATPTFGKGESGNLVINAANIVTNASAILVPVADKGHGGDLIINTNTLAVEDGGIVSTATTGSASGGDILINATDKVVLSGLGAETTVATSIATNSFADTGKAGNIEINTRYLLVENGPAISSTSGTTTKDQIIPIGGQGGNITINASESVRVVSNIGEGRFQRSVISAGTVTNSNSGSLTINTKRLSVENNATIAAVTINSGNGGDIEINATESVELTGTGQDGFPSSISAASGEPISAAEFKLDPPTGAAGNLNIRTSNLRLRDGGTISVSSIGSGEAGSISILADKINLDRGFLNGLTISGSGANINLQSPNLIELHRGSRISTDAGTAKGGNININSNILVAIPRENSDITANARTASGGQVSINVPNVFGLTPLNREQARQQLGLTDQDFANLDISPTLLLASSDIAAISQQSGPALQGTITFSTGGVNPAQGLVDLHGKVTDPAALIANTVCNTGVKAEFALTGKGGIPDNPNEFLNSTSHDFTWVTPTSITPRRGDSPSPQQYVVALQRHERNKVMIPAQGWTIDLNGNVTLVAHRQDSQTQRLWYPFSYCRSF